MFTKQVVLVAGVDYEMHGVDHGKMTDARKAFLIKKFKKEKLQFTIFDVDKGTVLLWDVDAKTGKYNSPVKAQRLVTVPNPAYNAKTNPQKTIQQLTPYNFSRVDRKINYPGAVTGSTKNAFHAASPDNVMSIVDVYEYVEQIGRGKDAGSLLELSIFSHGYPEGPLLVNSNDPYPGTAKRSPHDKDSRKEKDFGKFASAAKLTDYTNAFDENGIFWTWGCNFPRYKNIIFSKLSHAIKDKQKASVAVNSIFTTASVLAKIKLTDDYTLDFELDVSPAAKSYIKQLAALKGAKNKAALTQANQPLVAEIATATTKMDKIKKELKKFAVATKKGYEFSAKIKMSAFVTLAQGWLDEGFSQKAATATSVTTIGAYEGTYADIDSANLLRVMQDKDNMPVSLSNTIGFYQHFLNRSVDSEDRGYGVFQ